MYHVSHLCVCVCARNKVSSEDEWRVVSMTRRFVLCCIVLYNIIVVYTHRRVALRCVCPR